MSTQACDPQRQSWGRWMNGHQAPTGKSQSLVWGREKDCRKNPHLLLQVIIFLLRNGSWLPTGPGRGRITQLKAGGPSCKASAHPKRVASGLSSPSAGPSAPPALESSKGGSCPPGSRGEPGSTPTLVTPPSGACDDTDLEGEPVGPRSCHRERDSETCTLLPGHQEPGAACPQTRDTGGITSQPAGGPQPHRGRGHGCRRGALHPRPSQASLVASVFCDPLFSSRVDS